MANETTLQRLARAQDALAEVRIHLADIERPFREVLKAVQHDMEHEPAAAALREGISIGQQIVDALEQEAAREAIEYTKAHDCKKFSLDGFAVSVTESTAREIVDAPLAWKQAGESNLQGKVFKEMKLTRNVKEFNSWVDLYEPQGITVTKNWSASFKREVEE